MDMSLVVAWFLNPENIQSLFAVVGAFFTIAFFFVKLTPSKADDEFVQKMFDLVHRFFGTFGVKK